MNDSFPCGLKVTAASSDITPSYSSDLSREWASQAARWVKIPLAMQEMQETQVQSLGWEDPLEECTGTRSCFLAWRIPWIEEPDGLQSMGSFFFFLPKENQVGLVRKKGNVCSLATNNDLGNSPKQWGSYIGRNLCSWLLIRGRRYVQ